MDRQGFLIEAPSNPLFPFEEPVVTPEADLHFREHDRQPSGG